MPRNVALPTEGVDRNHAAVEKKSVAEVALPTEGVDRNFEVHAHAPDKQGRPPHGGRG